MQQELNTPEKIFEVLQGSGLGHLYPKYTKGGTLHHRSVAFFPDSTAFSTYCKNTHDIDMQFVPFDSVVVFDIDMKYTEEAEKENVFSFLDTHPVWSKTLWYHTKNGRHYVFKIPRSKVIGSRLHAKRVFTLSDFNIDGVDVPWNAKCPPTSSRSFTIINPVQALDDFSVLGLSYVAVSTPSSGISHSSTSDLFEPVNEGGRNSTLYKYCSGLSVHGHSYEYVLKAAEAYNDQYFNPKLPGNEVLSVVNSACKGSQKDAREICYASDLFIKKCLFEGNTGDARLFLHLFDNKIKYCTSTDQWLEWDGAVWAQICPEYISDLITSFLPGQYESLANKTDAEYSGILSAFEIEDRKKDESAQTAFRRALKRRARALRDVQRIAETKTALRNSAYCELKNFDTNALEINTKNGVFDFSTMELRPHSPSDMFLHCAGTEYDPEAKAPFFESALNLWFGGDKDTIEYIQKYMGICLTASIDEQMLLYCYGNGKNGKSAFFKVMKAILGSYYHTFPIELFISRSGSDNSEYYLADFYGKRLAVSDEIPEGCLMKESLVKKLTGGDEMVARPIKCAPIKFMPTSKIALFGNHKLKITGTDDGVWRRVKMIPFNISIPEEKRMLTAELDAKIKAELPGIFAFAVRGYQKYKEHGLIASKEISDATQEYKSESDLFIDFRSDCLEMGTPEEKIKAKDVFDLYAEWCRNHSIRQKYQTSRQFIPELRSKFGDNIRESTAGAFYVFGWKKRKTNAFSSVEEEVQEVQEEQKPQFQQH